MRIEECGGWTYCTCRRPNEKQRIIWSIGRTGRYKIVPGRFRYQSADMLSLTVSLRNKSNSRT
jgi:hypothetical protein